MSNESLNSRAQLLSDYAKSFISTGENQKMGFWSQLKAACKTNLNQTIVVPVTIDEAKKENDYVAVGFIPFCSIGGIRILVRPSENKREIIALENDSYCDLGIRESSQCEALVLAVLYLSAINDDFMISKEEADVIEAFLKCLQSSSSTIYQAKQFAFLGILNKFMDDKIVSDYEKLSISKFAEALELKKDDIPLVELEIVTVIDNINSLLSNKEVDDSAIMTLIKELQEMLGVIDNYKKLLDSSGISSQNITNGIEKLKGMFVSRYYLLLKGKKGLSQSDILEFSKYTSQIGTQQEWIKYYTDLLEETGKDNIIEQSFLNGNPIPIENPPVIMKKGEKAYFATLAEVTEVATQSKTHRLYAGTRVKLGGLPIYVGGSTPITTSREYLKRLGEADFVITI